MDSSKTTIPSSPSLQTAQQQTFADISSPQTSSTILDPLRNPEQVHEENPRTTRPHAVSISSSLSQQIHRASRAFEDSHPPEGFLAATGSSASSLISVTDTSKYHHCSEHPSESTQQPASNHGVAPESANMQSAAPTQSNVGSEAVPTSSSVYTPASDGLAEKAEASAPLSAAVTREDPGERAALKGATGKVILSQPYENGYHFPPSHTWQESTKLGAIAFWHFSTTPLGFFVVLYGLNVVAWGGMLFLLLCNASPAMCYPSCEDIDSPRRKWIEWDSQILNALFCVTGFGLAPWRFRDLYHLLRFRFGIDKQGLRRLAGIHRGWFRLQGSQELPVHIGPETIDDSLNSVPSESIPIPAKSIPNAPLTAVRAPATAVWKMDYVVWFNVANTFLQVVLSAFMWGMDRYERPSWSTGLFVALACIAAAIGGLKTFTEGKRVKAIEGVPVTEKDLQRLAKDKELGVTHYNNIKAKKPKEKKSSKEKKSTDDSDTVRS